MRKKIITIIFFIIIIVNYFFVIIFYKINNENKSLNDVPIEHKDIPIMIINGDISNINKKSDRRKVKIKYISENINFNKSAVINIHGSSSIDYDKKNYTIRLYEDNNNKKKYNVDIGWGKQNEYALKANWIDKSHSRNIVASNIIASMQKKYNVLSKLPNNGMTDGFPIEIYNNDEFLGLYTINIPKSAWMFNMDKDNKNNIVFNGKRWKPTTTLLEEANYNDWNLEVGPETKETLNKFNNFIYFLNNSTNEEFKKNANKYIDIDCAINFYIGIELFYLTDNLGKNIILITYDGIKWYPLLYDLDCAFATSFNGKEILGYEQDYNQKINKLFERLEENFSNEIADRYFEMRKDIITENNLIKEVRKFENKIPKSSFLKEKNKWKEIPGFGIDQIEDFIKTRIDVVDKIMNNLYKDNNVNKNPTKKLV